MKRELIVAEFLSTPWALMPERLAAFTGIMRRWQAGGHASPEVMAAIAGDKEIVAARKQDAARAGQGANIAVLPFYGVVTPGGEVGSIGVWQAHEDWSKAVEDDGVKVTLISAGKYKTEGNPYEPLGKDAQEFMQSRVDDYYAAFTKSVAKGRCVSLDTVRSDFGQGRVYGAQAALSAGMVNGVMTFDEVVKKMGKDIKTANRNQAAPIINRLAQAQRDLAILS